MDIKATAVTPPMAAPVPDAVASPSPPIGAAGAVGAAAATGNGQLEQVQHKQTFQHIFEQLAQQTGGTGGGGISKLAPKQLEHLRHLLGNVRDAKNLQLIVEKFKNLEQFQEHYAQLGNNNTVITEGKYRVCVCVCGGAACLVPGKRCPLLISDLINTNCRRAWQAVQEEEGAQGERESLQLAACSQTCFAFWAAFAVIKIICKL